jgi:hypothetical protein
MPVQPGERGLHVVDQGCFFAAWLGCELLGVLLLAYLPQDSADAEDFEVAYEQSVPVRFEQLLDRFQCPDVAPECAVRDWSSGGAGPAVRWVIVCMVLSAGQGDWLTFQSGRWLT